MIDRVRLELFDLLRILFAVAGVENHKRPFGKDMGRVLADIGRENVFRAVIMSQLGDELCADLAETARNHDLFHQNASS